MCCRNMDSEKEEILRSGYEELVATHERQHETQLHLTQAAVEIIRVNLLIGGIAASVVT